MTRRISCVINYLPKKVQEEFRESLITGITHHYIEALKTFDMWYVNLEDQKLCVEQAHDRLNMNYLELQRKFDNLMKTYAQEHQGEWE